MRVKYAAKHLQSAISHQKHYRNTNWLLSEQQLLNVHLYLTNSALYIATETNEQSKLKEISLSNQGPIICLMNG